MRIVLKSASVATGTARPAHSDDQSHAETSRPAFRPTLLAQIASLLRPKAGHHHGATESGKPTAASSHATLPAAATVNLVFNAGDNAASVEVKVSRSETGEIVVSTPDGFDDRALLQQMAEEALFVAALGDDPLQETLPIAAANAGEAFYGFADYAGFRAAMQQASQLGHFYEAHDDAEILMLQRLCMLNEQRMHQTFLHVTGKSAEPETPVQGLIDQVAGALSRLSVLQTARPMDIEAAGFHFPSLSGALSRAPSGVSERFEFLTGRMAMLIDLPIEKADFAEIDALRELSRQRDFLGGQVATPGVTRLLELAKRVADFDDLADSDPDIVNLRATLLATLQEERRRVGDLAQASQALSEQMAGSARLGKIATLEKLLSGELPFDEEQAACDPLPAGDGATSFLDRLRDRLQDLEIRRCQLILDMLREVEKMEHLLPSSLAGMIKLVGSAKAFSAAVQSFEQAQQRLAEAQDWRDRLQRWDHFLATISQSFAEADLDLQLRLGSARE